MPSGETHCRDPSGCPGSSSEARATHGVLATLTVHGPPRALPADVGLTVYRAAQEALTNTAKHAGRGATSELTLTWGDAGVELVARDRSRAAERPAMPASGYGLSGLRERAELAGGSLVTGPHGDGYELRLTLPYEGARTLR